MREIKQTATDLFHILLQLQVLLPSQIKKSSLPLQKPQTPQYMQYI